MKKILLALFLIPSVIQAQTITTIAGTGASGYAGDGGPATAATFNNPNKVAFDPAGNMYIADQYNYCIRKINTSGTISKFAGTGGVSGYSGDNGPATAAKLGSMLSIVFDAAGNAYFPDGDNHRICKVNTSGTITTFAGTGTLGYNGDGGQATAAELSYPNDVAFDAGGTLYISDAVHCVRKINTSGVISTVAGTGTAGYGGDGGAATAAVFNGPTGVAVDAAGNVYIIDGGNARIRKVNTSGTITTFAGNGTSGYSGNGGQATAAEFHNNAQNLRFDHDGNLYFADYYNNVIRKVNLTTGIITTIAGNTTSGFSGDGGAATACELNQPADLGFDNIGNAYIPDYANNRIRKITGLFLEVNNVPMPGETKIYPNPASTQLNISSTEKITRITITNMLGQMVLTKEYNSSQVSVDVSALPHGVYFAKVNGSEVQKFVKE